MFISDQPFYYISGWCSRKSIHLGQSSSLDAVHIHFGRFSSWGDVHIELELGRSSSWDDDHIQLCLSSSSDDAHIQLGPSSSWDDAHIQLGQSSSWDDAHIQLGHSSSCDDAHIQLGRFLHEAMFTSSLADFLRETMITSSLAVVLYSVLYILSTSSDDVHVKQMYTLALLPLQRMFPQNIACEIRHLQAWPFFHACPFHQSVGHIIIMLLLDWWLIAQLLVFLTSVALLST